MTGDHDSSRQDSRIRLYRDRANGKIMGVCAGLADYFGFSLKGLRVCAILSLIFFSGPTFIIYIVLGFVLPDKPRDLYDEPEEEFFWRDVRKNPAGTARDIRHKFRELERRLRAAEAHVTSREFKLKREIDSL